MPLPLLLLLFILLPTATAAEPLQDRLSDASVNPERVINKLLAQQANETLTAEDWLVISEAQLRLRNKDAAMDAITQALNKTDDPYLQAQAFLLKAQVYGILYRDTVIAITQLERAEILLRNAEDRASLALYSDVLQNFAQAYNQLGNIPKAIPYAEQSLALATKQQQPDAELKAHITLGRLMLQNNAFSQAYQHLNLALMLATQLQDNDALASIHLRLGMAYRKIEYHTQALEHLLQAKTRYQQLNRPSSYTYTLIYIAETYLEDAKTAGEAASYLNEALSLAREQEDLLRVGIATLGLGRLAVLQQNEELALTRFNDALQLFRQQQVQTYFQETAIALAELLLKRQQLEPASLLLSDAMPHIEQSATYLRYRFHDLMAKLLAAKGEWASAYSNMQQANVLRFEQQAEKSKLQLDVLNQGLQQALSSSQLQTERDRTDLINRQQQHNMYWLVSAVISMLLVALVLALWLTRRALQIAKTQHLYEPDWQSFCQRVQPHANKAAISLVCLTPRNSQLMKFHFGEQQLQQKVRQFLQQQPPGIILTSGVYDDVLWLAVTETDKVVKSLLPVLLAQFGQLLPPSITNMGIISLQLPLLQLQHKPWSTAELMSLREAFWLSAALCNHKNDKNSLHYIMELHSTQHDACEWRSSMLRQDLLNAIRLGSIELTCNDVLLDSTAADDLP